MHSSGLPEIVDQVLTLVSLSLLGERLVSQPRGDLVHLLILECLPEIVRDVEHHPLEEEHEGDPLVVGVNLPVVWVVSLGSDALVGSVDAVNPLVLGC